MPNNQEDKVSMTQEDIRLQCLNLAQVHFKKPEEVIRAAEQYAEYVKKGPAFLADKPISLRSEKEVADKRAEASKLLS